MHKSEKGKISNAYFVKSCVGVYSRANVFCNRTIKVRQA